MKVKSIFLVVLILTAMTNAMDFKIDDSIRLTQTYTDDIAAIGSEIIVDGDTRGNVFLMGGEIYLNGESHNSVYMMGGELQLNGLLWKNAYLFGGDILVNGTVHGDLNVYGGNIELGEKAEIYGMVRIRGGNVELDGRIEGPVNVEAENLTLLGTINNDVSVDAKNVERELGSLVTGSFHEGDFDEDWDFFSREHRKHRRGFSMAFFISSLLIGLLWQRLFPINLKRAGTLLQQKTVSMGLWGMIYIILIPIAAIILLVGVVTIPVSIILMSAYAFSFFLGQFPVAVLLGNLLGQNSEAYRRGYLPLIVGLIIFHLGLKIPIINALLMSFWFVAGFGAVWFAIINERRSRPTPVVEQQGAETVKGADSN
jgi:cytoskeletal protein CcmA (bactofilin family)